MLFPAQGLTPDKDYKIIFSGKHDQSVMGVVPATTTPELSHPTSSTGWPSAGR
jgi:hypothetical protein